MPIIKELFFRDYLESRLRRHDTLVWRIIAALHDRWVEAFLAGLVFSWIMAQHGR